MPKSERDLNPVYDYGSPGRFCQGYSLANENKPPFVPKYRFCLPGEETLIQGLQRDGQQSEADDGWHPPRCRAQAFVAGHPALAGEPGAGRKSGRLGWRNINDIDDSLLEQLSPLRLPGLPADLAADLEARLLDRLQHRRPGPAAARFIRETLDRRWQPVLISLLTVLLGWDLLRIIRYLLE